MCYRDKLRPQWAPEPGAVWRSPNAVQKLPKMKTRRSEPPRRTPTTVANHPYLRRALSFRPSSPKPSPSLSPLGLLLLFNVISSHLSSLYEMQGAQRLWRNWIGAAAPASESWEARRDALNAQRQEVASGERSAPFAVSSKSLVDMYNDPVGRYSIEADGFRYTLDPSVRFAQIECVLKHAYFGALLMCSSTWREFVGEDAAGAEGEPELTALWGRGGGAQVELCPEDRAVASCTESGIVIVTPSSFEHSRIADGVRHEQRLLVQFHSDAVAVVEGLRLMYTVEDESPETNATNVIAGLLQAADHFASAVKDTLHDTADAPRTEAEWRERAIKTLRFNGYLESEMGASSRVRQIPSAHLANHVSVPTHRRGNQVRGRHGHDTSRVE